MAGKKSRRSDADLVTELEQIDSAYHTFGDKLPKPVEHKVVTATLTQFKKDVTATANARNVWTKAIADKRASAKAARKLIKRVRSAVATIFGDDATELELVGIRRISSRKRPERKALKVDAPSPQAKVA